MLISSLYRSAIVSYLVLRSVTPPRGGRSYTPAIQLCKSTVETYLSESYAVNFPPFRNCKLVIRRQGIVPEFLRFLNALQRFPQHVSVNVCLPCNTS